MRLAVLVSGNGSNLQSLIDRVESGYLDAKISCVISTREDAYAIQRARKHGINNDVILPGDYKVREDFCTALASRLEEAGTDLVCLAGFMCVLSSSFVARFRDRIMNVHPSLIPAFCGKGMYGMKVHKAVLDSGVRFTGCTVHFVEEGCDTGPIIIQAVVPVEDRDIPQTLAARVLKEEHRIYPEAIRLFREGRLRISDRRVLIDNVQKSFDKCIG